MRMSLCLGLMWLFATTAEASGVESSRLALELAPMEEAAWAANVDSAAATGEGAGQHQSLGAERAAILLRSLTVPGWGQATLGQNRSAAMFALIEAGVWASFISFRVQESMRRQSYENTAQIYAGIDLDGRHEEFRRLVGIYSSSEEYNRLVVYRDAANLYYDDPVAYREYIAEHELKGDNSWSWESFESFDRYAEERKQTNRAALRANSMLGLAIANRLLSAVLAARHAGRPKSPSPRSWRIEYGPVPGDPLTLRLGVGLKY